MQLIDEFSTISCKIRCEILSTRLFGRNETEQLECFRYCGVAGILYWYWDASPLIEKVNTTCLHTTVDKFKYSFSVCAELAMLCDGGIPVFPCFFLLIRTHMVLITECTA